MKRTCIFLAVSLLAIGLCISQTFVGLSSDGGLYDAGGIFRMSLDGSDFYSGYFFESALSSPVGSILEHSNGQLYGLSAGGGKNQDGALFSMNPDGTGFAILIHFDQGTTGANPDGGLLAGGNGSLYGTMRRGGANNRGGIFRVEPDGTQFTWIHEFSQSDGEGRKSALLLGSDGMLYGTTSQGGSNFSGLIYRVSPQGTDYAVLHEFGNSGSFEPIGGLTEHLNGKLYGVTSSGGTGASLQGGIFRLNKDGSAFEELLTFNSSSVAGIPQGPLLMDSQGDLLGNFLSGGSQNGGAVFRCDSIGGNLQLLHEFSLADSQGFFLPRSGLIVGNDGKLYGTCSAEPPSGPLGGGVFRLNADGTGFEKLKIFDADSGSNPEQRLMLASNGSIVGTTSNGGADNRGVIFRMEPDGSNYSILLDLAGTSAGLEPVGSLLTGSNNQLYGMTARGGKFGRGVIYTTDLFGGNYQVIHDFDGEDGSNPSGTLLEGLDGKLYGVAEHGGINGNGVVFSIEKAGTNYSVIHDFQNQPGSHPSGGLVQRIHPSNYISSP